MKTKGFPRKLVLNKKTIVNLNDFELADVKGGDVTGSCPSGILCNTKIILCRTDPPICS